MRLLLPCSIAGVLTLAGCSTIDVLSSVPPHVTNSLVIAPLVGFMCVTDTAVLRVTLASSGAPVRVRWRSDSTRLVMVDDSGVIRARGVGTTRITAERLEDTTQQASLVVAVGLESMVGYTFTSIVASGTSIAVNPSAVHGAIDLISPVPGHDGCVVNPSYDRAELHVSDASGLRDTAVAVNSAAPIVPGTTVRFTFNTAARLPSGAAAFPNGEYTLWVRLLSLAVPQRSMIGAQEAITIANP